MNKSNLQKSLFCNSSTDLESIIIEKSWLGSRSWRLVGHIFIHIQEAERENEDDQVRVNIVS